MEEIFVSVPKGIESLLVTELINLGAENVKQVPAGASFQGDLELAYKVCLWSRVANRVLLLLKRFPASNPEELYQGIREIDWGTHFEAHGTFSVDFQSKHSEIEHQHYGALKVKDAIVDQFREKTGERPSVDLIFPDIRVNVFLHNDVANVNLDMSGESLHRRGYRLKAGEAPLKENLAAALLIKSGWPEIAAKGGSLVDPMCGAGSFPIEAAMIAGDCAPGALRQYFGFLRWKKHQSDLWLQLKEEAEARKRSGILKLPIIVGYDSDSRMIATALENLEQAKLKGLVHFEKRSLADCAPTKKMNKVGGLVIVNPPYGHRLGEVEKLRYLYAAFGEILRKHFEHWKAALFTGNPDLGKTMGIRARKISTLYNGALACKLLQFDCAPEWYVNTPHADFSERSGLRSIAEQRPEAEKLANRLRKNQRSLLPWLKENKISCYRIYDRDIPEYAVAVDIYEKWIHVQEYAPPKTVDTEKAEARLQDVLTVLPEVFGVSKENIFLKTRRRQRGSDQYERLDFSAQAKTVKEGNCQFLVNFTDYLDTGIFLDHRITREWIGKMAAGKHFLNLFAYTGTFTVYAAKAGARSTTTVDMSHTYLEWAKRNLALNGFDLQQHYFHQADCLEWIKEEKRKYDLIFLDPPTFSNSKKMRETFDVQRDHAGLIRQTMSLLQKNGTLIFSNNNRRFQMDESIKERFQVENITLETIPKDFQRNTKIHNCWKIRL